ncbi:TPA: hypothetical protein U1239_001919 [Streptococcus suis]|nr:hypothetical protein [Streptococcus suis]
MKLHLSKEINKHVPKEILSELLKLATQEKNKKIFHYFRVTFRGKKIFSIEHSIPILKWTYQLKFNKEKEDYLYSSIDIVMIADLNDIYIVSLKEFNKINK